LRCILYRNSSRRSTRWSRFQFSLLCRGTLRLTRRDGEKLALLRSSPPVPHRTGRNRVVANRSGCPPWTGPSTKAPCQPEKPESSQPNARAPGWTLGVERAPATLLLSNRVEVVGPKSPRNVADTGAPKAGATVKKTAVGSWGGNRMALRLGFELVLTPSRDSRGTTPDKLLTRPMANHPRGNQSEIPARRDRIRPRNCCRSATACSTAAFVFVFLPILLNQ
jgi:hypothetical protein